MKYKLTREIAYKEERVKRLKGKKGASLYRKQLQELLAIRKYMMEGN